MSPDKPTHAFVESPRVSPGGSAAGAKADARAALVVATTAAHLDRFPAAAFIRYGVHTTRDAQRMIETVRPRIVAIDWDVAGIDGPQVCAAARKFPFTGVLVAMASPESAPAALRAGCHAILLKPFAPNLVAARVGRLARELPLTPTAGRAAAAMYQCGTNRVWPATHCPACAAPSATSFEFDSYRRMWYACLACNEVWLGSRQE
jgi:DNA-binding response OmpR family regulator